MQGQAGTVLPGSSQEIRTVSGNSPSRVCSLQLGSPQTPSTLPHRQLPPSTNEPLGASSSQAIETTCREKFGFSSVNVEREAHPSSQHISPDTAPPAEQGLFHVMATAMRCFPGSWNHLPSNCASRPLQPGTFRRAW